MITIEGLEVPADPMEYLSETKFVALHGAADELVSGRGFDFDVEAVAAEEDIGGRSEEHTSELQSH